MCYRCAERQQRHRCFHEDVLKSFSVFEDKLSECAAEHVTSHDKCVAQQERATVSFTCCCLCFNVCFNTYSSDSNTWTLITGFKVVNGGSPEACWEARGAESRMSDAGLWSWKGRRAGCPLEALGVTKTGCWPPVGAHRTKSWRMEGHYC